MTCGYVFRGAIRGRRRPLCVRACRGRGARNPRTGTDGEGRSGVRTVPGSGIPTVLPSFWPLTCCFKGPCSLSSPPSPFCSSGAARRIPSLYAAFGASGRALGGRRGKLAAAGKGWVPGRMRARSVRTPWSSWMISRVKWARVIGGFEADVEAGAGYWGERLGPVGVHSRLAVQVRAPRGDTTVHEGP